MKKYTFGLKTTEYQQANLVDFEAHSQQNGEENNPYGKSYFSNPANMPAPNRDGSRRITSIPSPYARMHLTDLAFEELLVYGLDETRLSNDYVKAMSHCLDMFELFYRFDTLDLLEKGIKVERSEVVTGRLNNKWNNFLTTYPEAAKYIETLDLFRIQYLNVIRQRVADDLFTFAFTDNYIFKDSNDKIFGATSPFTGFFTTATCDLSALNLSVDGHRMFTANPQDWLMLRDRSIEFQDFMYILLNPGQAHGGLGGVFENLFGMVERVVENRRADLNTKEFFTTYPRFNFTQEPLPRLYTNNPNDRIYIRSSEMDSSYLKYLLFFQQNRPINFRISKDLYNIPIEQRTFPDNSETLVPWVGVNDLLSDALFVLPYDINDDYVGIDFVDDSETRFRRCLVPLKSAALKYFPDLLDPRTANERISIRKYSDGHYTVSLKVDIITNDAAGISQMTLRREYWPGRYDNQSMVYGRVYTPSEMDNFAFGIYPFVKSNADINIYKILFYNQLHAKMSEVDANNKPAIGLSFYRKDNDSYIAYTFDATSKNCMNYTSEYNKDKKDTINNSYYHVEGASVGQSIDMVEFFVRDDNPQIIDTDKVVGTSLIIPILPEPQVAQAGGNTVETRIAIDLGTSNTYVVYQHGNQIEEINMVGNDNKSELRFMHQPALPTQFNIKARYEHDLYLLPSKGRDAENVLWTRCVADQLCEFIPTHIMENVPANMEKAFTFPIPTLISPMRQNGSNNVTISATAVNKPLVHSSIPFAYYEVGKRSFDNPKGNFKWFVNLQTGLFTTNGEQESERAFISELLFIVRSHMLYKGYALDRCEIVWTYPLAFSDALKEETQRLWRQEFLKNFRSNSAVYINQPDTYPDIDKLVYNTNESLSPFYYCDAQTNAGAAYQILVDVGGGSSDIIGYSQGHPVFISSFNFAGNNLYVEKAGEKNVIRKKVNEICQQNREEMSNSDFSTTQRMGNTENICSLMNYGFQKFPQRFTFVWNNPAMHFLLKFHNAAIIYQTAQMCYKQNPNELPYIVHLTGNGSKLFLLLPENERTMMFNSIFADVFGKNVDEVSLKIVSASNPKFAAARGSLIGYNAIAQGNIMQNLSKCSFIALGDGQEMRQINLSVLNGSPEEKSAMRKAVSKNVRHFIDLFYAMQTQDILPLEKTKILEYLDRNTENKTELNLDRTMRNLFFEYIDDLMVGISTALYPNC